MRSLIEYTRHILLGMACVTLSVVASQAQTKPSPNPEQDDVIRVNTELVQTDVMVFDKKGRFVDGLKAEDFALKIDNKPQTISFFERVTSGKESAESKGNQPSAATPPPNTTTALVRGRIVIFFIDDLHLAPDSLARARQALTQFIERGMVESDQVAITSASGQIGFLQQFTNDRAALRSAVERLNYKSNTKVDMNDPPMSEYIALKIREGDQNALNYYVSELQKQNCFKSSGAVICTMSMQAMKLA